MKSIGLVRPGKLPPHLLRYLQSNATPSARRVASNCVAVRKTDGYPNFGVSACPDEFRWHKSNPAYRPKNGQRAYG